MAYTLYFADITIYGLPGGICECVTLQAYE